MQFASLLPFMLRKPKIKKPFSIKKWISPKLVSWYHRDLTLLKSLEKVQLFYQLKAGVVFWDKLTIGGYYSEAINDVRPANLLVDYPRANIEMSAAGGFIEYSLYTNKLLHLTIPVAIGSMEMEGDDYNPQDINEGESRTMYVEPAVQAEVNLHKYVRLHAGLGYRIMGDPNYSEGIIPRADDALSFQVGLKFGLFQIKK